MQPRSRPAEDQSASTVITCPECGARLKLKSAVPPGKRVKCPKCSAAFAPDEKEERRPAARMPRTVEEEEPAAAVARAPRKARGAPEREPEDRDAQEKDDEERPLPRKRRKKLRPKKKGSKAALWVGLSVGGGILLLAGICVVVALVVGTFSGRYARHEAAAKEAVGILNDLADAMESVQDPASARTAAVKINQICDRLEAMEGRLKALPRLTLAEDQRLKQQFNPEIQKVNQRLSTLGMRAGMNSRGEQSFIAAAQRLQQVGMRFQSLGM